MRRGTLSQASTAAVLFATAHQGFPVSTTHVVTGSILGTDSDRAWKRTRWGVARSIAIAWYVTMPCAAAVGALFDLIHRAPAGEAVTVTLVLAAVTWFVLNRQRLFTSHEDEVQRVSVPAPAVPAVAPA